MTPHDSLFHFAFRWVRHARSWFRSLVAPQSAATIDWPSMTPAPEKVRGRQLRMKVTDLLFEARLLLTRHRLFFAPEHKSYQDAQLRGQLLDYVVHVRHSGRDGRDDPPPLVLVAVLYHGEAPFPLDEPGHPHLVGMGAEAAANLAGLQPKVRFLLDDLSVATEASIRARDLTALATLTLLCLRFLRHCSPEEVLAAFDRWTDLLQAVDRDDSPPGCDAIEAVSCYALRVSEVTAQDLHDACERILQRPEETIMSTAERLRMEGEARGQAIGEARGRLASRVELFVRLLSKRFGALPTAIQDRIATADLETLDLWCDRLLDAKTLGEVFATE